MLRSQASEVSAGTQTGRALREIDEAAAQPHVRGNTVRRGTASFSAVSLACLVLVVLCAGPNTAAAAGSESVSREDDIVLTVDSRWPGGAYGGYFPLRMKLTNLGASRDLIFRYEGLSSDPEMRIPEVRRAVRAEQQASIQFTLPIPLVSRGTAGNLRVFDTAGNEFKRLSSSHALPDFGGHQPRTTLLVISSKPLDDKLLKPFEDAAATEYAFMAGIGTAAGIPGSYSGRHYSSSFAEADHTVVDPASTLPVNWLDYSGVDLIAVDWADWSQKLKATERDALLKWCSAGGLLTIYGTGKPAAQHEELHQSLKLNRGSATNWIDCAPEGYRMTAIATADVLRAGGATAGRAMGAPETQAEPEAIAAGWNIDKETFSHQDWQFGRIYVFPQTPFPGTSTQWVWWLTSIPKDLSHWPKKYGMSSRTENYQFLNFLIPGVGQTPVLAFLLLITLFTIVIGPLNYFWLLRRRRLAAMVFTVPAIALVTSLLLFGYSLVSDGFSIRNRVSSFTWLDQERKAAVSVSRLCLYAPFAPSTGLTFSPECAVFPIWQNSTSFEGGTLNWSGNDQRFASGWFRSQTWTQFQTVECRDERGRLDFTPPSDPDAETITVSNGLSWDLDYLAVKGSGKHWYVGNNVPAGATAQLRRESEVETSRRLTEITRSVPWEFPAGVDDSSRIGATSSAHSIAYRRYLYEPELVTSFETGVLRRNLPTVANLQVVPSATTLDWRDNRHSTSVGPHMALQKPHFWAICRRNPAIQTGVKSAVEQLSQHVVFGTF